MTPLALGLGNLLTVVGVSLAAGVGITAIYSIALLGAIRSQESKREGRPGARLAWAALGLVALLLFAAAVFEGMRIVAS